MPAAPQKVDVCCPHCGATQKEPPGAVSTFCRACGQHFNIGSAPPSPASLPTIFGPPRLGREIHCYKCGGKHGVSHFAKTTLCPQCGASIELGDLVVSANTSRPIDLRGKLTVKHGANLNNSWIICTRAEVLGRITGTVLCEEELIFHGSGKLSFRAYALTTRIEKRANLELACPLITRTLDIRGSLVGTIICSGTITIHKGGSLTGPIEARSVVIERGAAYQGSMTINPAAGKTGEVIAPAGVFTGK